MNITLVAVAEIVNYPEDIEVVAVSAENSNKFSGVIRRKSNDKKILLSTAFAFNSREAAKKAMNSMIDYMKEVWSKLSLGQIQRYDASS